VYLSLWKKVKVNWTRNLYRSMYKSAQQVGISPQSYLSPFLFHFYDQNNALTWNEKAHYMAAMANVQEQLAQGKTLDLAAPELDHLNQTELPLQPVDQGYTVGTCGPLAQQMKYQPSGEGTSRQEGSRCSPSPVLCAAQRRSPGSEDTEEERTSDQSFEATPYGSKRKPARPQATGPQSKVPCLETRSVSTRPVA
jgi:hypothetical protein